jgi:hypothetical protein
MQHVKYFHVVLNVSAKFSKLFSIILLAEQMYICILSCELYIGFGRYLTTCCSGILIWIFLAFGIFQHKMFMMFCGEFFCVVEFVACHRFYWLGVFAENIGRVVFILGRLGEIFADNRSDEFVL